MRSASVIEGARRGSAAKAIAAAHRPHAFAAGGPRFTRAQAASVSVDGGARREVAAQPIDAAMIKPICLEQ